MGSLYIWHTLAFEVCGSSLRRGIHDNYPTHKLFGLHRRKFWGYIHKVHTSPQAPSAGLSNETSLHFRLPGGIYARRGRIVANHAILWAIEYTFQIFFLKNEVHLMPAILALGASWNDYMVEGFGDCFPRQIYSNPLTVSWMFSFFMLRFCVCILVVNGISLATVCHSPYSFLCACANCFLDLLPSDRTSELGGIH